MMVCNHSGTCIKYFLHGFKQRRKRWWWRETCDIFSKQIQIVEEGCCLYELDDWWFLDWYLCGFPSDAWNHCSNDVDLFWMLNGFYTWSFLLVFGFSFLPLSIWLPLVHVWPYFLYTKGTWGLMKDDEESSLKEVLESLAWDIR